ncbi:MarR family transcriptional regulator [Halorientalis salina]|uniref:MarR family transcriptional regulator n=1 Tax=Halorientalis salina TaxID=2932266 RepID=UPI0010ABCE34|nr:helix-turn-helix domain-containing protein [Halorientalis salina]
MTIDIEEFNAADEEELGGRTNPERVLAFLARNADTAFRQAEVAEGAGVKRGSIGPVLSRLEERELVRHKGAYWAIGDPERIREAEGLSSTLQFLDERFGTEDPADWRPKDGDE